MWILAKIFSKECFNSKACLSEPLFYHWLPRFDFECQRLTNKSLLFIILICRSQIDVMSWWLYFLEVSFKDLVWSVILAHFRGKEKVLIPWSETSLLQSHWYSIHSTKNTRSEEGSEGHQASPASLKPQWKVTTYFPTFGTLFGCFHLSSLSEVSVQFSTVQSLSHVWLFATPWTAARQSSPQLEKRHDFPVEIQ